MLTKIIRGILGMLGVIRKTKRFDTSDNQDFLGSREAGEVLLIGPGDQSLPNGISAAEDGFWAHAFIFIGEGTGNLVRTKYPELLKNPKIPVKAMPYEIIEAEGTGIQIDTMSKYIPGGQMVGFSRKLTQEQLEDLLLWFYQQVGKPYGFLTFITELFPDPSGVPVTDPGWICSGLCAAGYWQRMQWLLALPTVNPPQADPCDLYNGLEPQLMWGRHFFNCGVGN